MELQVLNNITMSSLEIAEICGQRHDNFMAKVPLVLGESLAPKFLGTSYYTNGAGNSVPRKIYNLPKREACLMAMSYSYELQAAVYDKMTALEDQITKPKFEIPQTLSAALRLAADQADQIEVLQNENVEKTLMIEDLSPKAEFFDDYVDSAGLFGFRQVCKTLGIKENKFKVFLLEEHIMYYSDKTLMPYAQHLDAKRFEVKTGANNSGYAFTQSKFTAKGVEWIAELYKNRDKKQSSDTKAQKCAVLKLRSC